MRLHVAIATLVVALLAAPAAGHAAAVSGTQRSLRSSRDVAEGGSKLSTDASQQEEAVDPEVPATTSGRVMALMQLAAQELPASECKQLGLFILVIACCVSPFLQALFLSMEMEGARHAISLVNGVIIFCCCIHLYMEGMVHKVINGEPMGPWCLGVSLYAFLVLTCWAINICCLCMAGAAIVVSAKALDEIKNQSVRKIREQFDKMSEELSPDMKAYYVSQEFKDKCDMIFKEADKDGSGTLDMNELRETVLSRFTNPNDILQDAFFIMAFDEDGTSEIEKDEFYEMMKYFDMVYRDSRGTLGKTTVTTAPAQKALAAH